MVVLVLLMKTFTKSRPPATLKANSVLNNLYTKKSFLRVLSDLVLHSNLSFYFKKGPGGSGRGQGEVGGARVKWEGGEEPKIPFPLALKKKKYKS